MERRPRHFEFYRERKAINISPQAYHNRLKAGWPKELAATTPVRRGVKIKPMSVRNCKQAFGYPIKIGDTRFWRCTMFGFDLYKVGEHKFRPMYHATQSWGSCIDAPNEPQAIGKAIRAAVWYQEHLKRRINKYKEQKSGKEEDTTP